ncbi:MAG: nucleoside transporter C-terminal domain-containing protein [Pirellulaceae bacterium]
MILSSKDLRHQRVYPSVRVEGDARDGLERPIRLADVGVVLLVFRPSVACRDATNLLEAAAIGATDGMKLVLNVAAMLIAFLAMIAMLNALVGAGRSHGFGDRVRAEQHIVDQNLSQRGIGIARSVV